MSEDRRRHLPRKRDWPSPPRQEPFGRGGGYHGGGKGAPWSGKRGRLDSRVPWGRGGRGHSDNQRPGGPRFGGSRRGSPPPFEDKLHRREQGHRGSLSGWAGTPGSYPSDPPTNSRGFGSGGDSRGPSSADRRLPPPPSRISGSWDRHRDREHWDRDRDRERDAASSRLSSRESSPELPWRGGCLPPPPHSKRSRDRELYDPRDRGQDLYDRDPYSSIKIDPDEAPRKGRSKWDRKPVTHRSSSFSRDQGPYLPPPPPTNRSGTAVALSPRRSSHRSSRSPSRRRYSDRDIASRDSGSSRRTLEKLVEQPETVQGLSVSLPGPPPPALLAPPPLPEGQMSPVTPRETSGDGDQGQGDAFEKDDKAQRVDEVPNTADTVTGGAALETLTEDTKTPATDRSIGSETLAHSEDPPKRKRLGWGQGLARLRSTDPRSSGDMGDPKSPRTDAKEARDHASLPHTLCLPPILLEPPGEGARAVEPPNQHDNQPAPTTSPAAPLPTAEITVEMIASPVSASGSPFQEGGLEAAASPVSGAELGRQNSSTSRMSPVSPTVSRPRVEEPLASPVSASLPQADTISSSPPREEPMELDSPLRPNQALDQAQAAPMQPQMSKAAILAAIEKADADIEARNRELRELSVQKEAAVARVAALESEEQQLLQPLAESSSSSSIEEDISSMEISSVSGEGNGYIHIDGFAKDDTNECSQAGSSVDEEMDDSASQASSADVEPFVTRYPEDFELVHMARQLYLQNRKLAEEASHSIGVGHSEGNSCNFTQEGHKAPSDFPQHELNILNGRKNKPRFLAAVGRRKQELWEKEVAVTIEYRELYEQWREYYQSHFGKRERLGLQGLSPLRPASRKMAAARSEREERSSFVQKTALDRLQKLVLCLEMPDQILDEGLRRICTFPSKNALVPNPVKLLEEEAATRPWSADEKRIFMDKFMAYPKDFRAIASFLEHRSTADCVQFFYKVQKLDDFATVRRKQQLKKRRQQSDLNRNIYMGVPQNTASARGAASAGTRNLSAAGRVTATALVIPEVTGLSKGPRAPRVPQRPASRVRGSIASAIAQSMAGEARDQETPAGPELLPEAAHLWSAQDELLLAEGVRMFGRDFKAISKHMGYSRTVASCKSYFSKHKDRLGLETLLAQRQREQDEAKDAEHEADAGDAREMHEDDSVPTQRVLQETGQPATSQLQRAAETRSPSPQVSQPLQEPPAGNQQLRGFQPTSYFRNPGEALNVPSMPFAQGSAAGQQMMPVPGGLEMPAINQLGALPALLQMGMLQNFHPAAMQQLAGLQNYPLGLPQLCQYLSQGQLPMFGNMLSQPFNMLSNAGMMQYGGPGIPHNQSAAPLLFPGNEAGGPPAGTTPANHTANERQRDEPDAPEEGGALLAKRAASMWTSDEKSSFLQCFKVHGRDWKRLGEAVPNKTETQIKNYFQNYKSKLGLDRMELPATAIHPGQRRRKTDAHSPTGTPSTTPPPFPSDAPPTNIAESQVVSTQPLAVPSSVAPLGVMPLLSSVLAVPSDGWLPGHAQFPSSAASSEIARFPVGQLQEPLGGFVDPSAGSGWGPGAASLSDGHHFGIALQGRPQGYTIPAAQWRGHPHRQDTTSPVGRNDVEQPRIQEGADGGGVGSLTVQNVLNLLASQKGTQEDPSGGNAALNKLINDPELLAKVAMQSGAARGAILRPPEMPQQPHQKDEGLHRVVRYGSAPPSLPRVDEPGPAAEVLLSSEDRFRSSSQPLTREAGKRPHRPEAQHLRFAQHSASHAQADSSRQPGGNALSEVWSKMAAGDLPPAEPHSQPHSEAQRAIAQDNIGSVPIAPPARHIPPFGTADALAALGASQSSNPLPAPAGEAPSQLRAPGEWRNHPKKQQQEKISAPANQTSSSFLPALLQQAALMHNASRGQAEGVPSQPQHRQSAAEMRQPTEASRKATMPAALEAAFSSEQAHGQRGKGGSHTVEARAAPDVAGQGAQVAEGGPKHRGAAGWGPSDSDHRERASPPTQLPDGSREAPQAAADARQRDVKELPGATEHDPGSNNGGLVGQRRMPEQQGPASDAQNSLTSLLAQLHFAQWSATGKAAGEGRREPQSASETDN